MYIRVGSLCFCHFSNIMITKLCAINYKGRVISSIDMLSFRQQTPVQATYCVPHMFKVIIFKNKTCRIMGAKKPLTQAIINRCKLPFRIKLDRLQSCTFTVDFQIGRINLAQLHMSLGSRKACYEAEIFPALRLTCFNPMCINIFHSGKCVIMGYKSTQLDQEFLNQVYWLLCQYAECAAPRLLGITTTEST